MFRNSPLKNDRLQDFVKNEFSEELKLILDCKVRWNSLLAMIERFLKLKNCISKALRVIASTENVFEEDILCWGYYFYYFYYYYYFWKPVLKS